MSNEKIHWTRHILVVMLLVTSIIWFIVVPIPFLKLISLACFVGFGIGAIEYYSGKKWNFSEMVDEKLFNRMERKAEKRHAAEQ